MFLAPKDLKALQDLAGRVNFLPYNLYGAVVWIRAENNVDNRNVFVIGEQG